MGEVLGKENVSSVNGFTLHTHTEGQSQEHR